MIQSAHGIIKIGDHIRNGKAVNLKTMKTIMIAFREGSENGGPYNSHLRIIKSRLKEKYRFVPLIVPKGRMGLFNVKIIKNLVSQIKQVRPDAVQIIGLELIGYYLALACRISGVKKIIVAIHGSTTEAIEFNKNPLKKWIMEKLELFTLRTVTHAYGVSEYVYTMKNIAEYSKNYFGAIFNMMFEEETEYDRKEIRDEFGVTDKDIVIMSTGRITKEKGYGVLSEVMKHYKGISQIVFIIAGDGAYKSKMEEILHEQILDGQVKLLGYRSDISRILTAGDIFIMPSYHETFCISLLEAGQKNMALIASNVGGMREIVEDGINGYLVNVGDSDDIIRKIDLLQDKSKLEEMQRNAKQTIVTKFSNEITIERLDKLYTYVLEGDS